MAPTGGLRAKKEYARRRAVVDRYSSIRSCRPRRARQAFRRSPRAVSFKSDANVGFILDSLRTRGPTSRNTMGKRRTWMCVALIGLFLFPLVTIGRPFLATSSGAVASAAVWVPKAPQRPAPVATRARARGFIVGGSNAAPGSFPWLALVYSSAGNTEGLCTGPLSQPT